LAPEVEASERLVLIDTSVWVEALSQTGDAACRERVQQLVQQGRAATCEVVIAEVLRGAADDQAAARLEEALRDLHVLTCDGVGPTAASMGRRLRASRERLADLFIAAVAFDHRVALLTRDRHLKRIAATFRIKQVPA
jgi:predicted nucleic acid-binding protein